MRPLDDPTTFTALTEIKAIEQLSRLRLQRALPHGIEVSQFAVLNHFSRLGGEKSPAQLARAFQLTKGAMTNTLSRLEKAGYVRIRADERDGRRKLVSLTNTGKAVRDEAIEAVAPIFAEITEAIGREALRKALPALRALRLHLAEDAK